MRQTNKETFNMDLRRAPLPENCFCPSCGKDLRKTELLDKKCMKCGFIFMTNIHGEPIVISVPNGKDVKEVSGYMSRKPVEAMPIKEKVYKDGSLCPHCEHELTIVEMNAHYCKRCQNSYHVTPAGEPIIVVIDDTKDAKTRIGL